MFRKQLYSLFLLCTLAFNAIAQTNTNPSDTGEQIPTAKELQILGKIDKLTLANKYIESLSLDDLHNLPVALKKTIGNTTYVIGIDSVNFYQGSAYFNAFIAVKLPNTVKHICFEARQIRFNPAGVIGGGQSKLVLVAAPVIKINKNVELELNDNGGNFVSWNCSGFQSVSFNGKFIFKKGLFLPDSAVTASKVVDAEFLVNATDVHNIVLQTNITPFCIKGLKGFGFNVTNLTLDFSDTQNGVGMPIPPEAGTYASPTNWTGFYLKTLAVRYQSEFSNKSGPITFSANDMFIDKFGFTGTLAASPVLDKNSGSVGDWAFSIDQFSLSFYKSKLNGGSLSGVIDVPINKDTKPFKYSALINYNPVNEDLDYALTLVNDTAIEIDAFGAKIDIFPNSSLSISRVNGKLKPQLILNGEVKFSKSLTTPKLAFQNLTIVTQKPYIVAGTFALSGDSDACKLKGFEIGISYFALNIDSVSPRIDVAANMKLAGSGSGGFSLGVAVNFHVNFKYESQTVYNSEFTSVSRPRLKWKNVGVDAINLNITTNAFQFNGTIVIYENHPTYGDGFYGKIELGIEGVLPTPMQVTARFGRIAETASTAAYKYWYTDVYVPIKIPLGGGFSLNKIIGGAYYHMQPASATKAACVNMLKGPEPLNETQAYIPNANSGVGIKLGAGFYYTSPSIICGDAMLEASFSTSGGLNLLRLDANMFAMTKVGDIPSTVNSVVTATGFIQWNNQTSSFSLGATAYVNAHGIVTGTGTLDVLIEPGNWYFKAGTPAPGEAWTLTYGEVTPNASLSLTSFGYFQTGSGITLIQQLPAPFNQYFTLSNAGQSGGDPITTGAGVEFGLGSNFTLDLHAACASVNVGMGFFLDVNMMKYPPGSVCNESGSSFGVKGWFVQGVFCMYGAANISICGLNLCSATITAMLQGSGPNPIHVEGALALEFSLLNGAGKVSKNFDASYGDSCTPSSGADLTMPN
jgi:hypothetical protein